MSLPSAPFKTSSSISSHQHAEIKTLFHSGDGDRSGWRHDMEASDNAFIHPSSGTSSLIGGGGAGADPS